MSLPLGTKYYIPITVNKSQITESDTSFPYQWDLSTYLSNASFKAAISGPQNILVYDPISNVVRPRVVKLDLPTNKLLVNHDGPKSTSVDRVFYICAGLNLNGVNSASTFTNSGISSFWGFDEFVSGAITNDDAGGATGTVVAPASLGNAGLFGNCVNFNGLAAKVNLSPFTISQGVASISFIARISTTGPIQAIFTSTSIAIHTTTTTGLTVAWNYYASPQTWTGIFTPNQWVHIVITHLVNGTTEVFKNGISQGIKNTGYNAAATTDGRLGYYNGSTQRLYGDIDQFEYSAGTKTAHSSLDQYNMLFNPSTFRTFGSAVSVVNGGNVTPKSPRCYGYAKRY